MLAAAADPHRADAPIGLGMLYMQVGRETEAKSLFDTAFAADPFNVRADNMMRVLAHMASYTSIDSSHFSVVDRPDPGRAAGALHVEVSRVGLPVAGHAIRIFTARADQDRDPQNPRVVQRPHGRPAVRADRRRLHGQGGRARQPARHADTV